MSETKELIEKYIDLDNFVLLEPKSARSQEMRVSIVEKGEIRLNTLLMNTINTRKIEIFISKDCRKIILNPNGARSHKFTKAGTAKNDEIVTVLKKLKIKFPITYNVEWNEQAAIYEGKINVSNKV